MSIAILAFLGLFRELSEGVGRGSGGVKAGGKRVIFKCDEVYRLVFVRKYYTQASS
jgi:hypothetical protein